MFPFALTPLSLQGLCCRGNTVQYVVSDAPTELASTKIAIVHLISLLLLSLFLWQQFD